MSEHADVGWPGKAVHEDAQDLRAPLVNLLTSTKLVDAVDFDGVKGVIEANTLSLTKHVEKLIAWAAGGAGALGSIIGGVVGAIKNDPVLIAVSVGGFSIVLSAVVIGLALIVRSDIQGRAAVSGEQLAARAAVATSFLSTSSGVTGVTPKQSEQDAEAAEGIEGETFEEGLQTALAAYADRLEITTESSVGRVTGVEWSPERGLRIRLDSGDIIDLNEAKSFKVLP